MEPSAAKAIEPAARVFPSGVKPLTVSEVVVQVRGALEGRFPTPIWVEGELSNCSFPSSGHIYFSLVDERAMLPCAFFRGANQHLKFTLADGLKVLCLGQVTTYDQRGQYQLRVLRVEPRGIGALQLAFEQLKTRLAAEGLFDDSRKRPIPTMPRRVGIITSPSGSAIHDMVSKLRGWFHVVLLPVKVQGDGAAREISEALDLANRLRVADVLIVGRGGGSVEDLWAFNEELVARAIARSRIPVISAVGHQDDWTIADDVADLRASTPTDAAKLLVREREVLLEQSRQLWQQLLDDMARFLDDQSQQLDDLGGRLRLLHPLTWLERSADQARELQRRLVDGTTHTLNRCEQHLQGLTGRLQALSPLAVLARGYSITMTLPQRRVVTATTGLRRGEVLETLLAQGTLTSTVTEIAPARSQAHGPDA